MTNYIPQGFSFAGVYCGVKRDSSREDISLIVSDRPSAAAGVYTQNQVVAAPVMLDRQRTPGEGIRAIIINSGNANACTGEQGLQDAREMATLTGNALGLSGSDVLVMSTGIIGEHLPMQKIGAGISQAANSLGCDDRAVTLAARGMMTTDTRHKLTSRYLANLNCSLLGMAKGAAMIGPNMATMLGILLTDAPLDPATAQELLRNAVDDSFNCIRVEGHMSTNDTVLLLANGAAGGETLRGASLDEFALALNELSATLAREIPDDGEGATHLIEIVVNECRTREDATQIARAIADSPLVKTAVAGADPNWGRIVSAAGYAGVAFDPGTVRLTVNDFPLFHHGTPLDFDAGVVSDSIRQNRTTRILFSLGQGTQAVRVWTCDLTAEYVHLNADYHT